MEAATEGVSTSCDRDVILLSTDCLDVFSIYHYSTAEYLLYPFMRTRKSLEKDNSMYVRWIIFVFQL